MKLSVAQPLQNFYVVLLLRNWKFNVRIYRTPSGLSQYSVSLRNGRSADRIPGWARFSAPVQTGPGVLPASYTMVTGSFPGVKRPGSGVVHPPPSRNSRAIRLLPLWAFVACYRENCTFTFYLLQDCIFGLYFQLDRSYQRRYILFN